MSGLFYESNITTESNPRSFPNGSLVFGIDENDQKMVTSNETCLIITIAGLIIPEAPSFNLYQ